jgi:predicted porin
MFAKKNLIAVAALATLAVSAQAQSSVTLYGNVDVAVAYSKFKPEGGSSSSTTAVESSILTESFFGLKGQEDLGGGLKAVFKLESFVNVDTGSAGEGNFWGKNAYVGLAGDFGTVKLGNQESLFKTAQAAYNPFGTSVLSPVLGTSVAYAGFGGGSDLFGSWQNTIGYESNNYGGLTFAAQHSAREGNSGNVNGGATAASVNYTAGALGLSAVYGDVRSTSNTDASDVRQRAWLLGASYDFGVAKGFAQYGQDKFSDDFNSETAKTWQLGAVVPVTQAGGVHVAYGQAKFFDEKIKQFSLAYHHSLSKRTSAYVGGAYVKADDWFKQTTLAVGVRHAF